MDLEWIRRGLEKPGKTKAGLAKAMGNLHPSQASRLLDGKRHLKAAEVAKIAAYLGEGPPNGHPPRALPTNGLPTPEEIAEARKVQAIMFKLAGVPQNDQSLAASLEIVRALKAAG